MPVLLAGCLPAPYGTYYRPSLDVPGATAVRQSCGGQAGPPSRLRAPLAPSVRLDLSAASALSSPPTLGLDFTLSPGATLRFASAQATLDGATPVAPRLSVSARTVVAADAVVDLAALSPVEPARATGFLGTGLWPRVAGWAPPRMTLQWPAVRWSDGRVTRFEPVALTGRERRGWIEYRSAAESAAQAADHARCQRETPQRRCENILQSYENGFTQSVDGLTLKGRLFVTDPAKPELTAFVSLDLPLRGPWRWEAPHAVLSDDSGRRVTAPLERSTVHVGGRDVALDTAVSAPWGAAAPVSVWVVVPLAPPAADRYRVTLPPVVIDGGAPRVLPPIELERRSLDGGIEPFNC